MKGHLYSVYGEYFLSLKYSRSLDVLLRTGLGEKLSSGNNKGGSVLGSYGR